jgi:hypothetical protein
MEPFSYSTNWFADTVTRHTTVQAASPLANRQVRLVREDLPPITIAPITTTRVSPDTVRAVLEGDTPTAIVLIPKLAHYDWSARELAEANSSTVLTFKELYTYMAERDLGGLLDKNVDYNRRRLEQHGKVRELEMICEASMQLKRYGGLSDVALAVEYHYEFSEEAVVAAIEHHPGMDVILNANPNGRVTEAALAHAKEVQVPVFGIAQLMGALNYDGERFRNYIPPEQTWSSRRTC